MSWRDFSIYRTAYDRQELNEFMRTREIVYAVICTIEMEKGKTRPTKEQIWPLPTDQKPEKVDQSDIQRLMNFYSTAKANPIGN